MSSSREIRLIGEFDGGWSVIDVGSNVASQGKTREEALRNLDDSLALHTGEAGEPIEDEAGFLGELGIDPDEVTGENEEVRPSFLS